MTFTTHQLEDTISLGRKLGTILEKGDIICLSGDLGSGKTTLTKGIADGLNIPPETVNSPTFVVMNRYVGRLPLYHFDLYRLDDPREIVNIGYEEFLYGNGVTVIEWAEKLGGLFPKEYLKIRLIFQNQNTRRIEISAQGKRAKDLIQQLSL